MKLMKKISSLFLAFVMVVSLCAGFGTAETVKAEESSLIDEIDIKVNPAVVDAYENNGQLTEEMLDELFIINEEDAPYYVDSVSMSKTRGRWSDYSSCSSMVGGEGFREGYQYMAQCTLDTDIFDGFSVTTTNATEGYVLSAPAASRSTGYYAITVSYYFGEDISLINLEVDWESIPEITFGQVAPVTQPSEAVKVSGTGIEQDNPESKVVGVAIKTKEEHIVKGYIDERIYEDAQNLYNGWMQIEAYQNYTINETDEYAIWTYAPNKYGYKFSEVNEEYAGRFESNVEVVDNFINNANSMVVFLRLGTLEEIESEKELAGSGHTHSYEYIITEAATATEEGVMIGSCSCGKTEEVVIPVTGTSGDVTVESEATNAYTGKLENQEEIENIVPLTKEEQLSIVNGDDLVISLVVKDIKDTVSAAHKTEIEKKLTGKQLGTYLDVKLLKQIGSAQATEVTNTKGVVKIAFVVPEELRSAKRTFTILRLHNGVVDEITPTFDATTNTLTFETDRFSTYALVYKDAETTPNNGQAGGNQKEEVTVPKTGDVTSIVPYIMICGLGCAMVVRSNKKRDVL